MEAYMAQIQVHGDNGEFVRRGRRQILSLFPGRSRNGPDENAAADKLPMPR
jgi:hypothetical protein